MSRFPRSSPLRLASLFFSVEMLCLCILVMLYEFISFIIDFIGIFKATKANPFWNALSESMLTFFYGSGPLLVVGLACILVAAVLGIAYHSMYYFRLRTPTWRLFVAREVILSAGLSIYGLSSFWDIVMRGVVYPGPNASHIIAKRTILLFLVGGTCMLSLIVDMKLWKEMESEEFGQRQHEADFDIVDEETV